MSAARASRLPSSVVTRLVPIASGTSWTPPVVDDHPDPGDTGADTAQGVLWEEPSRPVVVASPAVTAPVRPGDEVPLELRTWAHRFAQAVVEVVAGHRPPTQLVRWTSRTVYRDLERRTRLAQRAATAAGGMPVQRSVLRPQVRSVHMCVPGAGIAEASVHVRHGRRSRAVAMRFEAVDGRWRCTAMEFA
jgi:hypothetical protein